MSAVITSSEDAATRPGVPDPVERDAHDFGAYARNGGWAFALKVAISEGRKTEYFWVNRFVQVADASFEGEIANDARLVKTVRLGQRYTFPRARIVDWTYIDKADRSMVGNFTLCALLTQETRAEVYFDRGMRGLYATDASLYQVEPVGVVVPRTSDDVVSTHVLVAEDQVEKLQVIAAKCPVHRTLEGEVFFEERVELT